MFRQKTLINSERFIRKTRNAFLLQRASNQIRKIAGCACAGNAGNVFPTRRLQRKLLVSDPGMHHVMHVGIAYQWRGENVPGIPSACAPTILRIWQEAHCLCIYDSRIRDMPTIIHTKCSINLLTLVLHKIYDQTSPITLSRPLVCNTPCGYVIDVHGLELGYFIKL